MEKISLKLYEFYNLDSELSGVVNQQNGEKISSGLLAEKLKLTTKYWLTELSKKVAAEKAVVETLKEELIKKHGETDETGNISIPMYINIVKDENDNIVSGENNPKFIEFQNEFNELLQEEKELEYKTVKLNELENIESEGNYPVFFKLVTVDEQA
jgi:uncharacterized protein (UPF0216 family)